MTEYERLIRSFLDNIEYVFILDEDDFRLAADIWNAIRTNYNFYRPQARVTTIDRKMLILIGCKLPYLEESIENSFPNVRKTYEEGRIVFAFT